MPSTVKAPRGRNGNPAAGNGRPAPEKPRTTKARAPAPPTHDQIARRAYELYEASGCQPGREQENWLRAEAELADGR